MAEPVAVVRDEDGGAGMVFVPSRPPPRQVERAALRADHVGHGVQQRAQLRLAIAGPLYRLGVETERDVVHEHPPVHLGEIDPPLPAVDKGIQSADDVVAVDPQVEGEVVPGPRGHARVGKVQLRGDRRDDRLRSIPAGHREAIGSLSDRISHQLAEVGSSCELDGSDPARPRLLREGESLRLASAGLRVVEEHGVGRG